MSAAFKLEVEHLAAGYGDVQVLWEVTINIQPSEVVCLVGSNGAGKTTFMRCVSGLLPVRANIFRLDGRDMTNARPADFVAAGVAHVPEGRRLFRAMSVRDNLLMGAYLRTDADEVPRDLDRIYSIFPVLAERRRQDAGTLSGGEQQMCAIGRALMGRPSLLLIDELSLGLSPRIAEQLVESLRIINKEGVAILLVEQDVVIALEFAQRAFVMDRGRITMSGEAANLAADPAIREAYMGLS
ncbi:MAG TPA: ABC transporter ATP-binding protein [Pseudolabrys sp.]|jgi:branched-chain amino acid transport system ATP-binding protein|nr:ABC transporter ATP-binding protein [Pseudolabrys sp.]